MLIKNKKVATYVLLSLIIAFGFFLRIYNVSHVPPGLYTDEAVNGTDALQANETGHYQWFYPANNGREGLFMNIIAMCFKAFGASIFSLRLPAVIFGTLTIFGTYLLAKELFGKRVGLISSFLVAVSYWPLNFSRISFRANMLPFVLTFSFYFLFKGLRTKKILDFIIGGLFLGLGLHTYIAFRVTPLILVVALVALIISRENFLKNYWKHVVVFILFTFLAAAPMLYTFFYAHPEYWASRTSEISILNPAVNQGHLITTFLKTFGLSLVKYNFWGDQNWRHNYPPYPILDPITGLAFLFGFIYMLIKTFHLLALRFFRKVRDEKLDIFITLLAWFFVMLIPEFLGMDGNPHALRSIGTLPVVFILAAFAFNYLIGFAERKNFKFKAFLPPFIMVLLIFIGMFNPIKYFFFWAKTPQAAVAFDSYLKDISDNFRSLPESTEKYFVSDEYESLSIKFLDSDVKNVFYSWPDHIKYIYPKDNNFVIVMVNPADIYVQEITRMFPNLKMYRHEKIGGGYYLEFRP